MRYQKLILGLFFLSPIFLSSCQDQNSFTGDEDRFSSNVTGPADSRTCDGRLNGVKAIMGASCASCHPTFASNSYREWIDSTYVRSGDADASTVFFRLRNSGVGNNQTMPPTGALSATDIATIREWIVQMATCL